MTRGDGLEVAVDEGRSSARDRPIFVVGSGRSGTDLLQSLLGAHPRIAALPEVHFFSRIYDLRDYWGDLNDDAVLRRVIAETVTKPSLARCGFDVDALVASARLRPRTYADVLDAVMSDFTKREGKARWSEKSPLQTVTTIWQAFPDAQIVHIVRDPRDSIPSTLAKTSVWDDATVAAHHWRAFTALNIEHGTRRGLGQYFRIRYEDLAQDAVAVMRTVFSFLNEDFDPLIVTDVERRRATIRSQNLRNERVLEPIEATNMSSSRELVSRRELLRIEAAVARLLPTLGYDVPSWSAVAAGRMFNLLSLPRVFVGMFNVTVAPRFRSPRRRYELHQQRTRRATELLHQKATRLRAQQRRRDGTSS